MIFPTTADDITTTWLTGVLAERHPGVEVSAVEVTHRDEVTNSHARLRVEYRHAAGASATMFAKLAPNDERREAIIATGMGHREARFYADLAHGLDIRVPAVHAALTDDSGLFAILLEDLVDSGCRVSDGTWGISADGAAQLIEDLAAMHVRFEDPARRAAEAPWVTVNRPNPVYGQRMLRHGVDHHRDRLSDDFVAVAELCIGHHSELQRLWHEGPQTIIHGDTHIGNVFVDGDRVGVLDWGIINVNTPMREIAYLLTMAMNAEDRRAAEVDLLHHYLGLRRAAGVAEIGFDEAWAAYRVQAAYNVLASCQVVTFPADATPARQVFAAAFLARAEASIADLESLAALRAAGIG